MEMNDCVIKKGWVWSKERRPTAGEMQMPEGRLGVPASMYCSGRRKYLSQYRYGGQVQGGQHDGVDGGDSGSGLASGC